MSAFFTRERPRRYAIQLALGAGAGIALGMAMPQAHAENAASLLADPTRLETVQAGCKTNQSWATEALCREAAQAIRLRFRSAGVHYTPRRVGPQPIHSATKAPAPATPLHNPEAHGPTLVPRPVSGRP